MNEFPFLLILIFALFLLMALRAFKSGSKSDYVLAAVQCFGLLLLLSTYIQYALYLLLLSAAAYLASQVVTGARPVSRLLPLIGAAAILLFLLN